MAGPSVALCVPSNDSWKAITAFQLICLTAQSVAAGINLIPINIRGQDTAEARNRMVPMALEQGADYLFWVDADMVLPAPSLIRLLNHNVDIVGADYRRRTGDFGRIGLDLDGNRISGEGTGLVERGMIGLGCLLIKAAVFRKLEAPWFARLWLTERASADNPFGFATEDSYLCNYARHHGYTVWCDMDLTREVQHIGEMAVPWDMPGRP